MTNNKQQTAVEWLVKELNQKIDFIPLDKWDMIRDIIEKAKEMEKEQMEAASKNSEAFADGYSQGYNRALELAKWALSNLIPPHNEQK
jgi:predicted esterase